MTKKSLVERVMSFLKGGDEAKIARFDGKLRKYLAKQVAMRKERIESLEEKIEDAKEKLEETIENVDPAQINQADSLESYCRDYTDKVERAMDVVTDLEDAIEDLKAEIAKFEAIEATIYGEQK